MSTDCANNTFLQRKIPNNAATILIVEDEDDLATLLEYRLREEGFTPLIATNGDEACQLLDTNVGIDLVLLDILLPVKDGWDVCRFIRNHTEPRIAALPVIMLSALSAGKNRVRGMECGADAYLAKPYSVKEVILNCHKMIAERQERHRMELEVRSLHKQKENSTATRQMLFHELRSQFTVIG
ncbi:MAG: response regulator, partial [Desulfobulbaceae bacterium]|nr:response regulator [Desulfobulbaceae bacterium]